MKIGASRYSNGTFETPLPDLDSPNTLVLAFAAPELKDSDAFKAIRSHYPTSVVIGCSTSGEIYGARVDDNTVSIAVAKFEKTSLSHVCVPVSATGSHETGQAIGNALANDSLRSIFLLSDGLDVNGSELVRGVNEAIPASVTVTGGLAGDGPRFENTWVVSNEKTLTKHAVAVGFSGDALVTKHSSRGGWDIFGPKRTVTRSEGNVLFELDNKPALSLYQQYLGDLASELPASGLLFPLSIHEGDKRVVRTILAIDREAQSLTFAGDVPQGATAQLMKANFDRLVEGAEDAASALAPGDSTTLSIAISCVGRRLVLRDRVEEEVEATLAALTEGSVQTGFYSYGELSPLVSADKDSEGVCALHNQTMTLTAYSEM